MKDAYESLRAENAMLEHDNMLLQAEVTRLTKQLADCRNELCLKCGKYREAHNGSCDGCRWRENI